MENLEKILDDIEKFDHCSDNEDLPDSLNDFLKHVAKTGDPVFPWIKVKHVIRHKLSLVMSAFYQVYGVGDIEDVDEESENMELLSYSTMTEKIIQQFDTFTGAPFTIQRICEMLLDPRKHYQNPDKFIRGMEKNILVVSCISPGRVRQPDTSQESIVNGMIEDVSLHLGVNSQENNCDSGMTNATNEVTANGLPDDPCSSSSSSGSSSASSSPIPEDEPMPRETILSLLGPPSPKRMKLVHNDPISYTAAPVELKETPSCSTQVREESSIDSEATQVDTSEQSDVCLPPSEQSERTYGNNSPGSPDSAQDSNKSQIEVEQKEADNNSEAAATPTENIEESSKEADGSQPLDSSEADSTCQPSSNEASSTQHPAARFCPKQATVEAVAPSDPSEDAAETEHISTSDKCNSPPQAPVSAPCTSSLP